AEADIIGTTTAVEPASAEADIIGTTTAVEPASAEADIIGGAAETEPASAEADITRAVRALSVEADTGIAATWLMTRRPKAIICVRSALLATELADPS
ncbi:MAG: hypothetical protein ACJ790_11940, partial [Myxococcaceae bacterium]